MRINQIVGGKPSQDVVTISPEACVRELVQKLGEHNVGALVVSRDGHQVDGIVSERDVVRRMRDDDALLDKQVSTIMTGQVHTCAPDHAIDDLMTVMTERRIRHVPVVEDGRLVGIISIGDVVKHRIGQLEFERDQLDSYVQQT